MGIISKIIGLVILIIMVLAFSTFFLFVYEEIKYSWKMNQMINENNATCYLERGVLKIPLAKICTWNNTLQIEKRAITSLQP